MILRVLLLLLLVGAWARAGNQEEYYQLPIVGEHSLRIISPEMLELNLVTTKEINGQPKEWNFIDTSGKATLPQVDVFEVTANGAKINVTGVGFKRRVLYAPLRKRDLRIGNHLYLQLEKPLAEGQKIEVKSSFFGKEEKYAAQNSLYRLSDAIHINQTGYHPAQSKKAMIGYYLGSLGEMKTSALKSFKLLTADLKTEVYQGSLTNRLDYGFPFTSYQQVVEADFSSFTNSGEYRLAVDGLGVSYPFFIHEGYPATLARTYALGLYHQRCGCSNTLPFTRFTHTACHLHPAEVPTASFTNTQKFLLQDSANATNNVRHTAPVMKDFAASLYPFVKQGQIDVSKGHHDAGDYSKYTINSAGLIHNLVFAADAFPGVGELDNLGIPESGDGLSDLLQEANWEAEFLAKLQDDDGGFYFLVYPRERRYEHNVLPEFGDKQIVWPKTTAATGAAVAALAQISSSPLFKKQFPEAAKIYLKKAEAGWAFLERAIEQHGKDGAYQKITHYGDDFMHDDELAWAACELYLATGDSKYQKKFMDWYRPDDANTRKWGWWRLYDGYGNAARSYAFAVKSGRLKSQQTNPLMMTKCENEVAKAAEDQLQRYQQSAYGTSFPVETKRVRAAGWYFSSGAAFDLAVGMQISYPVNKDLRPKFLEALLANFNYELGCNPVNVSFVTGLGFKPQQEIVHHYAQNDQRALPLSGIPIGNLQSGFGWLDFYKTELGALTYPLDGAANDPFPIYDRWGDSFNVQAEFVVVNQARALAASAFLMAQTSLKSEPWRGEVGQIQIDKSSNPPIARLVAKSIKPGTARIIWETSNTNSAPKLSQTYELPKDLPDWIEVEAVTMDGKRIVAVTNFVSGAKNK
ncbi:MAG TPA: glycoside hydrolase family 9 protein [Verrucomicrobiae bacterium]